MHTPIHLTLTQTIDGLKKNQFSIAELYDSAHGVIAEKNPSLNVFVTTVDQSQTLQQAHKAQQLPLAGVPVAIKDNICTKDLRTTASSKVLESFKPPFSATVAEKTSQAGGVCIGKANLDAWAHGSSTETSQFGRTLNPRNPEHLPGGSSGGSAAAVAANMCSIALGTETAGSIRQPAAWCGVVGLKPTYGRVSRYGIAAMASSTDSPGPIGKTVADTALMLNFLAGKDPLDGTSSQQDVPDFTTCLGTSIKGMKIGVVYTTIPGMEDSTPHLFKAIEVLESLGAHAEVVEALDPRHAVSVYTVVQRAEVSSNLAGYNGVRYDAGRSAFGPEAKRRIMLGTYTLSKGLADQYYMLAQKVRTLFKQDYDRLFQKYDALVSLTSPGFAKKIGASEGAAMFGELEDMLLEPSSITGLPGISVPCYHDTNTNLFLGLNIVTPMWKEEVAIQLAHAYEQATTWNTWNSGKGV